MMPLFNDSKVCLDVRPSDNVNGGIVGGSRQNLARDGWPNEVDLEDHIRK